MIVDTGILIAAASRDDAHHEAAKAILSQRGTKVIPESVVGETSYMIARRGSAAEIVFQRGLLTRTFAIEQITRADRERIIVLLEKYSDADLGYVDASVAAVAERLGEAVIATLDKRDFSLIRPSHVPAFTLIP